MFTKRRVQATMKNENTKMSFKLGFHLLYLYMYIIQTRSQVSKEYFIPLTEVSDCLSGDQDPFHQFYDISRLECRYCAQNTTYQTTGANGLYSGILYIFSKIKSNLGT